MVGLSDLGLYQRTLLVFHGEWSNVTPGQWTNGSTGGREPLITVAVDLQQGLWVARGTNWQLCRERFLGAVSGRAKKSYVDIVLESPRGEVTVSNYFANDAPRRDGPAFRGDHPMASGAYAQRTYWWRYDDPSIMTPFDRMAEMLDRAIRSPKLRAQLSQQLGGLISPEALLPLAGTFFALFGAEFVGGAAAALTVGRLLGVNQLICDFYFYEPRAKQLHHICMNAIQPRDLEFGADLLVEILCQLISDVAMAVGITALSKIASSLFSMLMSVTPESVRLALRNNAHAAAAYIRGKGYARTDLLKSAAGTPLEPAAVSMYKRRSESKREIIVLREPDATRLAWVRSSLHHNSKPPWLKARSKDGMHGLVCLPKSEVGGALKPAGHFETAQLRGGTPFDAEHLPSHLPMYDMPLDGRPMGKPGQGIDYHYTGHENVSLQGHKLVDMGDRYLVVDAMGRPYVADVDTVLNHRPGLSETGAHLPTWKGNKEDHPIIEWEMNRDYERLGGHPTHNPANHGGRGATVAYTLENIERGAIPGKDYWTPKEADGSFKSERLVIFVPEWTGRGIESRMYVLDSWGALVEFARGNNMKLPW